MRFSLPIFFIFSFCIACGNKKRIPANILPQQKMTAVIWDLVKADEFVNSYIMKDSTRDKRLESTILYEQVFRIHHTSKEQFQKSVAFYQDQPTLLKTVLDSLKRYENKITEEAYKLSSEADSSKRPAFTRPRPVN